SENSSLGLETQSYQRLFQMKTGASQQMEVNMNAGSSFVYLPHPVVPHEDSKFTSRNKIFMSGQCSLVWGEVLTCGRKLNGEAFCFSSYHNITEIFLQGRLVVKENLLIQPGMFDPSSIGQLEGFTHQATLIIAGEQIAVKQMIEEMRRALVVESKTVFGVSELPVNGLIVRILGSKAEQLFELIKKLALPGNAITEKKKLLHEYAS
ncbi:MAG: urease accessory protein UreD, partial [Flavisolibacter sp.]